MASKHDVVKELLEYFVAPLLPRKSSLTEAPLHEQQLVATQIHAVVMLYNYYHRKQNPGVEFLCSKEFSELAVTLKPSLRAHMKFMDISGCVDVDGAEPKVSVTEKSIIDACDSCVHLDASKEVPNIEGWPISGVSVLLIDSDKQNCSMVIHSVTQGVWSLIEKCLDDLPVDFEEKMKGQRVGRKRKNMKKPATDASNMDESMSLQLIFDDLKETRKRKNMKKPAIDASNIDEAMCLQLAFDAVKEVRGISSKDLVVLESHVVYSLRKAKTSVRFYIMQYNQSFGEDIRLPIKLVLKRMKGPLVEPHSSMCCVTTVVEFFHVLPYAAILAEWFSSQVNNDKQKGTILGFDFDSSDQEQ